MAETQDNGQNIKDRRTSKRIMAFELYAKGFTQTKIAEYLQVDINTISGWKERYKWEERFEEVIQPPVIAERLIWKIMLHNLRLIEENIDLQENGHEEKKPVGTGDIDALVKLLSKVKLDKVTPADIVREMENFLQYLRRVNPEGAKMVYEDIINYSRSVGNIL